jgi:hypothetical protein
MKQLLLWITLSSLTFAKITIITSANSPLKPVTKQELADLYLGKISKIQGLTVTPIDNIENYKEFYMKITGKTPKEIKAYWMRELYKGDRTPPKKMSTKNIKALIEKNHLVISYAKNPLTGKLIFTLK